MLTVRLVELLRKYPRDNAVICIKVGFRHVKVRCAVDDGQPCVATRFCQRVNGGRPGGGNGSSGNTPPEKPSGNGGRPGGSGGLNGNTADNASGSPSTATA